MSNKPWGKVDPLDKLIRQTSRCGMTDGTIMTIEFISGFENFNTRPYHNYETWGQGYRVHGLGVLIEREDLDDAIKEWAKYVVAKRAGESIPPHADATKHGRDGGPYRAAVPLPDWIKLGEPTWLDGVPKQEKNAPTKQT